MIRSVALNVLIVMLPTDAFGRSPSTVCAEIAHAVAMGLVITRMRPRPLLMATREIARQRCLTGQNQNAGEQTRTS